MARITEISDEQKKLQGHNRFVKNVPQTAPITKLWHAPRHLSDQANRFYHECGEHLIKAKVLTELDKWAFFDCTFYYDELLKLKETLRKEGGVVYSKTGVKKHPAITAIKEINNIFIRLLEKFGLTPADRKKINLPVDSEPHDPARDFIFKNYEKMKKK